MKHIKTFESFLNESHLPFDIEKKLALSGISFELDEERTNDDDDNRFDFVEVYSAKDRGGHEWVIKTGITSKSSYILEIMENDKVVFSHEYSKLQKAYFEQDCANSLGFAPELD